MARRNAPDGLEWREVQLVLEEEVGRLPAAYKAPFVLCYLEGRSRAEAASFAAAVGDIDKMTR